MKIEVIQSEFYLNSNVKDYFLEDLKNPFILNNTVQYSRPTPNLNYRVPHSEPDLPSLIPHKVVMIHPLFSHSETCNSMFLTDQIEACSWMETRISSLIFCWREAEESLSKNCTNSLQSVKLSFFSDEQHKISKCFPDLESKKQLQSDINCMFQMRTRTTHKERIHYL